MTDSQNALGNRPLTDEEIFYYTLLSSEGGQEVFEAFCQIWSGCDKEKTVEALEFFSSNSLALEPSLNLSSDKIEPFLKSQTFKKLVLPWFEDITCDGERASRTLEILLKEFFLYHLDPMATPKSLEEALREASDSAARAVAEGQLARKTLGIE